MVIGWDSPCSVDEPDGPQSRCMPDVAWPKTMIGQPPCGGVPFGTNTEPDTSVWSPVIPDVDV
ncbi:Uncharacterised protein [Mycobacteroides abscessus subsp. abscessus]|nr:Uncharacterised protein [Mycobacteroides abscessus subsp. abscessus]